MRWWCRRLLAEMLHSGCGCSRALIAISPSIRKRTFPRLTTSPNLEYTHFRLPPVWPRVQVPLRVKAIVMLLFYILFEPYIVDHAYRPHT